MMGDSDRDEFRLRSVSEEHGTPVVKNAGSESKDITNVDQKGVTGGNLQDSTAAGENSGTILTNHVHGNQIINLIAAIKEDDKIGVWSRLLAAIARESLSNAAIDQEGIYSGKDKEVNQDKKVLQTFSSQFSPDSDIKTQTGNINTADGSSVSIPQQLLKNLVDRRTPETDADSASTKSLHPTEQDDTGKDKGQLTEPSCSLEQSPCPSEPDVKGQDLGDVSKLLQNISVTDGIEATIPSDLGIERRDPVQCEEPDICLKGSSGKHLNPGNNSPDSWCIGLKHSFDKEFVRMTDVTVKLRLITKHSIETTVDIGLRCPKATRQVLLFLKKLYFSASPGDKVDVNSYILTSGNIGDIPIYLGKIRCHLTRSKTKQNVEKIVYLAEVAPDQSEEISVFLDEILFELIDKCCCTIPLRSTE